MCIFNNVSIFVTIEDSRISRLKGVTTLPNGKAVLMVTIEDSRISRLKV